MSDGLGAGIDCAESARETVEAMPVNMLGESNGNGRPPSHIVQMGQTERRTHFWLIWQEEEGGKNQLVS